MSARSQSDGALGTLALLGDGQLHCALVRRLEEYQELVAVTELGSWTEPSMLIAVADTSERLRALRTQACRRQLPYLSLHGELDRVVIGPVSEPSVAGCAVCVDRRRACAAADDLVRAEVMASHGREIAGTCSPLLGPLATDSAAAIAIEQVIAFLRGERTHLHQVVTLLNLATLEFGTHRFLPDPLCPHCGSLPDDTAEAARITPRTLPKPALSSARTRDILSLERDLIATYVDEETGLLTRLRPTNEFAFPVVSARLHPPGIDSSENGYGRTLDFRSARVTAIAEALERLGGLRPGGRRTRVRGTYRALREHALNPRALGLYPEERYATERFPFQRYHEDLEMAWVWGHSFGRGKPLLVPEAYAYYRIHHPGAEPNGEKPFVYEISNGCALGSCVEEAIVHALLEVVERDAFLMTWLAQMPVPRLDPSTAGDHRIPLMAERIRSRTGYEVLLFNNTLELGIPTFWVMGLDSSGLPARPRVVCGGGSALGAERGVISALQELATSIEWQLVAFPKERERAQRMLHDSSLVRVMHDHALLYSHPEAFARFAFLSSSAPPRSFADFREQWRWPDHADLADDLREVLGRFLGAGLDVIVVDQTTCEHTAGGFACVKVIVPGMLPMTFGHHARRVDDMPRLFEVPHRLGYRDRPLTSSDINPHPHPFP